jgi:hypothetical protein
MLVMQPVRCMPCFKQCCTGVIVCVVCCSWPQAPDQLKLAHLASSADPICAITVQQHLLLVGRSSGVVHAFSLPALNLEGQYVLHGRPQRMLLNCDCSRLAVVDFPGVLNLLVLGQGGLGKLQAEQLSLERKVCTSCTTSVVGSVVQCRRLTAQSSSA